MRAVFTTGEEGDPVGGERLDGSCSKAAAKVADLLGCGREIVGRMGCVLMGSW